MLLSKRLFSDPGNVVILSYKRRIWLSHKTTDRRAHYARTIFAPHFGQSLEAHGSPLTWGTVAPQLGQTQLPPGPAPQDLPIPPRPPPMPRPAPWPPPPGPVPSCLGMTHSFPSDVNQKYALHILWAYAQNKFNGKLRIGEKFFALLDWLRAPGVVVRRDAKAAATQVRRRRTGACARRFP